jgi:transcriptional regulator with XRE-family HTH domain
MADDPDQTQERPGEEGRFAGTWQNKAAGRALKAARVALGAQGSKQSAFAATLSRELGIRVSPTTLSGWETGRRTVPAPVWIAAAMASQQSIDALLGESGAPEVTTWAEGLGLPQRLEAQAAEVDDLRTQLHELRQQYGEFYAAVVQEFSRHGWQFPSASSARPRRNSVADREASG